MEHDDVVQIAREDMGRYCLFYLRRIAWMSCTMQDIAGKKSQVDESNRPLQTRYFVPSGKR